MTRKEYKKITRKNKIIEWAVSVSIGSLIGSGVVALLLFFVIQYS